MKAKDGRIQITKAVVEAAHPPAAGQRFIRDAGVLGFGVRITADGAKSFVWEGRVKGRVRRITIARYPDFNVALARAEAQKLRTAVAQGRDPAAERLAERREPTFGVLVDAYLDNYAKLHRKSWRTDERRLAHCGHWNLRRLSDIARTDVERLQRETAEKRGRVESNRTVELLRAMFGKALLWNMMPGPNPALGVERFPEQSRERFLSPEELRRVNEALLTETDWRWRAYFPLAFLLGPRKTELLQARWIDVDLDQKTWRIPTTKAGRSHILPIPGPAIEIIESLPSRGQSEWLFPVRVNSASGHAENAGVAWKRIRERAGVPDVRIHDLRRTLGSWLAGAGYSLPVIGKTLNHSNPASTSIYARVSLDPIREALEKNAALMIGEKR